MAVVLLILNRFSTFFHFQILHEIFSKALTKDPTTPHTRCYTTLWNTKKGSPYSITERRIPELIPVLGSQPVDDVSHKPGGRLPLLSARQFA